MNKAVQESLAPKKSVIDVLKKNLEGWKPARDHSVVHASDITKEDFCPRRLALLHSTGKKLKDEYISAALQATFDVGNATGDMVAEVWGGNEAIGNWECIRCAQRGTFCSKPQTWCSATGHKKHCNYRYEEVNFVSSTYDVSGGIDVFFDLGGSKKVVTELKILNVEDFAKLAAPMAEHRIRTRMYLKLIDDSSHPFKSSINLNAAKILYVSRGFGKKDPKTSAILPFKEFDIERDDESVQPYLDKAMQVKVFKEDGVMPAPICSGPGDKPAKKCSVCTECWHLADKQGLIYSE
jgi:hypothetical protein